MKKLISAALALALTLSLAACGGGGGGGQGSTPNNPGAASSGGSDKPFAGQTLTVLYMSGVYADAARAMVPEFEEATGAKVEVVDFPYLTLHEKALLDLTSQTGSYDVIDVASQWDGEFAPFMEPLDSYIERDNYDMSVWIENVLANCGEWQGTIVGIPNASTPQTFAYRTDLLPDGIPDTWEGYREALAQVNDPANGLYGVTVSEVSGQLGGVFDYVLWSMGGNWATPIPPTWPGAWTSPSRLSWTAAPLSVRPGPPWASCRTPMTPPSPRSLATGRWTCSPLKRPV